MSYIKVYDSSFICQNEFETSNMIRLYQGSGDRSSMNIYQRIDLESSMAEPFDQCQAPNSSLHKETS